MVNFNSYKRKYETFGNLEIIYDEFHEILMGETPYKLNDLIEKHREGIKKDIASVLNAISYEESSEFIEGNHKKFIKYVTP